MKLSITLTTLLATAAFAKSNIPQNEKRSINAPAVPRAPDQNMDIFSNTDLPLILRDAEPEAKQLRWAKRQRGGWDPEKLSPQFGNSGPTSGDEGEDDDDDDDDLELDFGDWDDDGDDDDDDSAPFGQYQEATSDEAESEDEEEEGGD